MTFYVSSIRDPLLLRPDCKSGRQLDATYAVDNVKQWKRIVERIVSGTMVAVLSASFAAIGAFAGGTGHLRRFGVFGGATQQGDGFGMALGRKPACAMAIAKKLA